MFEPVRPPKPEPGPGLPRAPRRGRRRRAGDRLRQVLAQRLAFWSDKMGVRYRRVFIKNQRTRWGSCSKKGNLNFNRRLLWAPPEVLDYVIVHELGHLVEMNHSKRFWALVADWCPDYRKHKDWLRENSRDLGRALPISPGDGGCASEPAGQARRSDQGLSRSSPAGPRSPSPRPARRRASSPRPSGSPRPRG
ncbi:MAG: M48 family metallopeptidase [Elusimicrobia bacterium]|nr:M48 family metallopeptidase [Elusimicrobiota bacterium]